MKVSVYEVSVPVFKRHLASLEAILDKAAAHAEARKIDPSVLLNARLYPDMHPLVKQVQIASDTAKGLTARLAGHEPPAFEDTEKTFVELKARIQKTVAFLNTITPAQIDGTEDNEVIMKVGGNEMKFKGFNYLIHFAIPNFYFHITAAYAILRHSGVELGKRDFIGQI